MRAISVRDGLFQGGGSGEAYVRPAPQVDPAPPAPPVAAATHSVYGERTGPSWTAITAILAVHAGLLFALVRMDVIAIAPRKPVATVVQLLSLAPPPPPAADIPDVAPVKPPVVVVVAPPPLVQTAAPPPPIAVVAAPPPPQAVIVAPVPPAKPALAAAPVAVDLSANLVAAKPPRYPTESRRKREQGTVLLRLLLGTDGAVSEIGIARSSGFERLDQAALEAVRRWRWSPTMQAGQAVQVRGVVSIPFMLQG